jgi:hypothetical protein
MGYRVNCRIMAQTTQSPMKRPNSFRGIILLPRLTRKLLAAQIVVVMHDVPLLVHIH